MFSLIKWFFILLILSFLLSCSASKVEFAVIKISGSDTMLPLTEKLAEEFMIRNPTIAVYVEGGGTASGVKSIINGYSDICTASRALKPHESKMLADYYGSVGMFYLIAKDALSVFVNNENIINSLSMDQLKRLFTCKINNWKEVGGNDEPVLLINRNFNSGTYSYFKEHVLDGEEYCSNQIIESTTQGVINSITENIGAIGYGGISYGKNVKAVRINNVEANENNARNDKYPITRYLHFFTTKTPSGAAKKFIDFSLSQEGQQIIKESGFIPLWEITR